jgi:16S rRNA G966 N2-methylase RsmD
MEEDEVILNFGYIDIYLEMIKSKIKTHGTISMFNGFDNKVILIEKEDEEYYYYYILLNNENIDNNSLFGLNTKEEKSNKDITITDATANAGGTTIDFLLNNLKVNSIELSIDEYDRLKNNINLYSTVIKNDINVYNVDCLDYIYNKKVYQDIIYFDPPWGGNDYKNYPYIGLSLDDRDISEHISNMLTSKLAKLIVLKGPHNTYIKDTKYLKYKIIYRLFYDDKFVDYYNLYFFISGFIYYSSWFTVGYFYK